MARTTLSSRSAAASISSFAASRAIVNSSRLLPFTCTAMVMVLSTKSAESGRRPRLFGQKPVWPRGAQQSSARCGNIGPGCGRAARRLPKPEQVLPGLGAGILPAVERALASSWIWATAALKRSLSIAIVTAASALMRRPAERLGFRTEFLGCRRLSRSALGRRFGTSRQMRCRKRCAPSTPAAVHSMSRSGGVSDSMNQRAVSAP